MTGKGKRESPVTVTTEMSQATMSDFEEMMQACMDKINIEASST